MGFAVADAPEIEDDDHNFKMCIRDRVVAPVRMDGKVVNHETIRATNVYVAAYIFIFAASFFLISLDGFDTVSYTHLVPQRSAGPWHRL